MAKEKFVTLENADIKSDAAIRYDFSPWYSKNGDGVGEGSIILFRGDRMVFISNDERVKNGDRTCDYFLMEMDIEAKTKRLYKVEFVKTEEMSEGEEKSFKFDRKCMLKPRFRAKVDRKLGRTKA